MNKIILPAALLVGTGGIGYVIYKNLFPSYEPYVGAPPGAAVTPPAAGIKAKYGNFDVFVPADTLSSVLGGIAGFFTKGGTKPKQPTAPDAEAKTDLNLPSGGSQSWALVKEHWDALTPTQAANWLRKAEEFEAVHGYDPLA